ncbi:MAG: class I SAM-dependent methyltransferase [Acidimicrobiales bacterium]
MSNLRFYGELASWWPLISPPEEYAEEAMFIGRLFKRASIPVNEVLELGCGGGNNASHLKSTFTMFLTDVSPEMLAMSQRVNPDCAHAVADMRTARLGRQFDGVLIHDAVDYMTSEADLRLALETAFLHTRPGGVSVFVPDETREQFAESSVDGGNDGPNGWGVRFLSWTWDPDPSDDTVLTEYAFMLRTPDAPVRIVHETHENGVFRTATWLRLMEEVGFEAKAVAEVTLDERVPRTMFIGLVPG